MLIGTEYKPILTILSGSTFFEMRAPLMPLTECYLILWKEEFPLKSFVVGGMTNHGLMMTVGELKERNKLLIVLGHDNDHENLGKIIFVFVQPRRGIEPLTSWLLANHSNH